MKWQSISKRIDSITNGQKIMRAKLVFMDGSTKVIRDDFINIMELINQGTEKTGIVDVLSEYDDGFYQAFENENGNFDEYIIQNDDSEFLEGIENEG